MEIRQRFGVQPGSETVRERGHFPHFRCFSSKATVSGPMDRIPVTVKRHFTVAVCLAAVAGETPTVVKWHFIVAKSCPIVM